MAPEDATCFCDVAGWAGCGEAELVPVGRGRKYKGGKPVREEKGETVRWAGRLQGAVAWFSARDGSQCEAIETGNRVTPNWHRCSGNAHWC